MYTQMKISNTLLVQKFMMDLTFAWHLWGSFLSDTAFRLCRVNLMLNTSYSEGLNSFNIC